MPWPSTRRCTSPWTSVIASSVISTAPATTTPRHLLTDTERAARDKVTDLDDELMRATTLENTPAAFMDDRSSYDDDVVLADIWATPASEALEDEITATVAAHL